MMQYDKRNLKEKFILDKSKMPKKGKYEDYSDELFDRVESSRIKRKKKISKARFETYFGKVPSIKIKTKKSKSKKPKNLVLEVKRRFEYF